MGVDIFFVISGYLIFTIIYKGINEDNFNFIDFYARRIRRIFPALLLVLFFCYIFGFLSLLSDEYKTLGKHIQASTLFFQNYIFLSELGYFDVAAEKNPLLHLWSLAIEEQFYILLPLVLWVLIKKKIYLLPVIVLFAILSFGFNIVESRVAPMAAFFSSSARFWELLVGCILSYLRNSHIQFSNLFPFSQTSFLRNLTSLLGVTLIWYAFFGFGVNDRFPGWWATIPVIGAVFILASGRTAWLNKTILAQPILVWFGLISFPLYLWHWPILSFARIASESQPLSNWFLVISIFFSIFMSWITYRYVEMEAQITRHKKFITLLLIFMMALFWLLGAHLRNSGGYSFRFKEFEKISAAAGEWGFPGNMKSFLFEGKYFYTERSLNQQITLFVGDSNAEQYYPRVNELIKNHPSSVNSVVFATHGDCLPIPGTPYDDKRAECQGLAEAAYLFAVQESFVKKVVVVASWNQYLSRGYALNGDFKFGSPAYKNSLVQLQNYLKRFKSQGKEVYLILNMPGGEEMDPKFMAKRTMQNFPNIFSVRSGGIKREALINRYGSIQEDLLNVGRMAGVTVIEPFEYVCDAINCPSVDKEGVPIYKDGGHFRAGYIRHGGEFIDQVVDAN